MEENKISRQVRDRMKANLENAISYQRNIKIGTTTDAKEPEPSEDKIEEIAEIKSEISSNRWTAGTNFDADIFAREFRINTGSKGMEALSTLTSTKPEDISASVAYFGEPEPISQGIAVDTREDFIQDFIVEENNPESFYESIKHPKEAEDNPWIAAPKSDELEEKLGVKNPYLNTGIGRKIVSNTSTTSFTVSFDPVTGNKLPRKEPPKRDPRPVRNTSPEEMEVVQKIKEKAFLDNVDYAAFSKTTAGHKVTLEHIAKWIGRSTLGDILENAIAKAKPEPLHTEEEMIINFDELADGLAVDELRKKYGDFLPDVHCEEYKSLLEEKLKIITNYKR